MKAAVVVSKSELQVLDVPVPEIGPYDVLCKMLYGATCAGTDIHLMDGRHPYPVSFPTVLGHESIGRVIEAGDRVRNYKIGDIVTRVGCPALSDKGIASNWGGFAEYGVARDHWAMKEDGVDRSEWERYRVNQIVRDGIDIRTAPMIITWRETLSYIRRLGIDESSRVLVIGSGANALSLAVHCVNSGASVLAVGSRSREDVFRRAGIDDYLDYRSASLIEDITDICAETCLDYIIDGVGSSGTVNITLPLLAQDGVVGVYGWNDRSVYRIDPFAARRSFRVYADGYDEEESNEEVQQMILDGKLDAGLWYDLGSPYDLDEIGEAYRRLRGHEALKYLIDLQGGSYE